MSELTVPKSPFHQNLNDHATAVWSPYGQKILVRHWAKSEQRVPDEVWVDGTMQFYDFMNIFGPHTYFPVQEVPFENNEIYFPEIQKRVLEIVDKYMRRIEPCVAAESRKDFCELVKQLDSELGGRIE